MLSMLSATLCTADGAPPTPNSRDALYQYARSRSGPLNKESFCRQGQQTIEVILDVIQPRAALCPGLPTDTDTAHRIAANGNTESLLRLLMDVNAPLPVDDLCEMVESGAGRQWIYTVLLVLAQSGQSKALAYLEYVRDQTARSPSGEDKHLLAFMDNLTNRWACARYYLEKGTVPTPVPAFYESRYDRRPEPFKPGLALETAHASWQASRKGTNDNFTMDDAYLEARLRVLLPRLNYSGACLLMDYSSFGRFHEKALAPLLMAWLSGDRTPLESVWGGRPVCFNIAPQSENTARSVVSQLTAKMTGDLAFAIKCKLALSNSLVLYAFDFSAPEKALAFIVAMKPTEDRQSTWAECLLWLLAKVNRPLSVDERKAMTIAVSIPKQQMLLYSNSTVTNEVDWIAPLARREAGVFAKAMDTPHLSMNVIRGIACNKLSADTNSLLTHIQYAMLHDNDKNIEKLTPEQLAKVSPFIKAMYESSKMQPRRVNVGWLPIIKLVLPDDAQYKAFLKGLAADPEFDSAKSEIEHILKK